MNTIKFNLGGRDSVVVVVPSLWTGAAGVRDITPPKHPDRLRVPHPLLLDGN